MENKSPSEATLLAWRNSDLEGLRAGVKADNDAGRISVTYALQVIGSAHNDWVDGFMVLYEAEVDLRAVDDALTEWELYPKIIERWDQEENQAMLDHSQFARSSSSEESSSDEE